MIYLVPGSEGQKLDNRGLQEQRKVGRTNSITAKDIVKAMHDSRDYTLRVTNAVLDSTVSH